MAKRNLGDLVKNASADLQPDPPMVRGRGLEGMLSTPDVSPAAPESVSPQVDMSTSKQKNIGPARSVKSFRMRDDLSHQIEIIAAQERRKIYEVIEEAIETYLAQRKEAGEA